MLHILVVQVGFSEVPSMELMPTFGAYILRAIWRLRVVVTSMVAFSKVSHRLSNCITLSVMYVEMDVCMPV